MKKNAVRKSLTLQALVWSAIVVLALLPLVAVVINVF